MADLSFLLPDEDFEQHLNQTILPTLAPLSEPLPVALPDGAALSARVYATPNPKAVVCICHGFSEFADKYAEVCYNFVKAGYAVAICEHRGHGFSTREVEDLYKVHIDDYSVYVRDYDCFVRQVIRRFPALPRLLLCHSMGGCIGALYLEQHPKMFCAAVLSSPMLELNTGNIAPFAGWMYTRKLVKKGLGKEYLAPDGNDFDGIRRFEGSSCLHQGRYDAWFNMRLAQPMYQTNSLSVGWALASLQAQSRAVLRAKKIKTQMLLCQAGLDHLVLPRGQNRFAARAKDIQLKKFPTARHEIFNSPLAIRRDYWGTVLDFYSHELALAEGGAQ